MNHFETVRAINELFFDLDEFLSDYIGNTNHYPADLVARATYLQEQVDNLKEELGNL